VADFRIGRVELWVLTEETSVLVAYNISLRLVKIEDCNSWPICSVLTISVLQHFATSNALFLDCIACNGIARPIARSANYTTWFIQRSVFQNYFFCIQNYISVNGSWCGV
jgi:hypothetical protein